MRSPGRCSIFIALLLVGALLLWFPGPARPQVSSGGLGSGSHTEGRDFVQITKVTPRTSADIPTPSRLPFSLEVSYRLATSEGGKLRVGVFRWLQGTSTRRQGAGKLAAGLEALAQPLERSISKGSDVVTLTTLPVVLQPPSGINSQVIVVVNIRDSAGREVCWATSHNFLRGQLVARPDTAPARADAIQVLSFDPRPGVLETGNDYSFQVNLRYNLKTRDWGFVNVEIGEGSLETGWAPWYTVVVPVSRGTGLVRVKTRPFFIPAISANQQIRMLLPFRVEPLGGTVQVASGGQWTLTSEEGP